MAATGCSPDQFRRQVSKWRQKRGILPKAREMLANSGRLMRLRE
jgi:hypothetical protein